MKKGLTFIECLISILILSILLTAGMSFYLYSHQSVRYSIDKKIVLELANSKLEEIRNSGYSALPNPAPVGGLFQQSTKSIISNLQGTERIFVYDRSEADPANGNVYKYKEVQVQISWQQPGRAQESVTLVTYVAP